MSYLGLSPTDAQNTLDRLAAEPIQPPSEAGLFAGAWRGIEGIPSALGQLTTQVGKVLTAFADFSDPSMIASTPQEFMAKRKEADAYFDRGRSTVADYFRPDPTTTGWAGQTLYGVSDVGTRFAVGSALGGPVGGAAVAGGSVYDQRAQELVEQGATPEAATKAALVEGGAAALGGIIPAGMGGSLARRVLSGAAINVGLGAAQRGAEREILEGNAPSAVVDQIKAFSFSDAAADAVLGAAFGGLSYLGREPTTADLDAALSAKAARSHTVDSLPGTPEDIGDMAVHAQAMDRALDALYNDEPVMVDAAAMDARFQPFTEISPGHAVIAKAMDEAGYAEAYEDAMRATREAEAGRDLSDVPGDELTDLDAIDQLAGIDAQRIMKEASAPDRVIAAFREEATVPLVKRGGMNMADVEATLKGLPEVPEGHVRLYRAESPTTGFDDVFRRGALADLATDRPGKFYTDDLKYADYYRSSYGKDAQVTYLDVPEAVAEKSRVGGNEFVIAKEPALDQDPLSALDVATDAGLRNAADMNSEVLADFAKANEDSPAMKAATDCFLRNGIQ